MRRGRGDGGPPVMRGAAITLNLKQLVVVKFSFPRITRGGESRDTAGDGVPVSPPAPALATEEEAR